MIRTLVALSVFAGTLFAQRNVSPEHMYHRVWAVVPLVGSGAPGDPRRPMLVPSAPTPGQVPANQGTLEQASPGQQAVTAPPDLLGFQMQLSDDGKFALVEFVFQSPLAFHNFLANAAASPTTGVRAPALQAVAADGSDLKALPANVAALKTAFESSIPGLKLFERGKATPTDILSEFRKHKASFNFSDSSVVPQ